MDLVGRAARALGLSSSAPAAKAAEVQPTEPDNPFPAAAASSSSTNPRVVGIPVAGTSSRILAEAQSATERSGAGGAAGAGTGTRPPTRKAANVHDPAYATFGPASPSAWTDLKFFDEEDTPKLQSLDSGDEHGGNGDGDEDEDAPVVERRSRCDPAFSSSAAGSSPRKRKRASRDTPSRPSNRSVRPRSSSKAASDAKTPPAVGASRTPSISSTAVLNAAETTLKSWISGLLRGAASHFMVPHDEGSRLLDDFSNFTFDVITSYMDEYLLPAFTNAYQTFQMSDGFGLFSVAQLMVDTTRPGNLSFTKAAGAFRALVKLSFLDEEQIRVGSSASNGVGRYRSAAVFKTIHDEMAEVSARVRNSCGCQLKLTGVTTESSGSQTVASPPMDVAGSVPPAAGDIPTGPRSRRRKFKAESGSGESEEDTTRAFENNDLNY
jgi:hypothetical protein